MAKKKNLYSGTKENPINLARLAAGMGIGDLASLLNFPYRTVQDNCMGLGYPSPWIEELILDKIDRYRRGEIEIEHIRHTPNWYRNRTFFETQAQKLIRQKEAEWKKFSAEKILEELKKFNKKNKKKGDAEELLLDICVYMVKYLDMQTALEKSE